LAADEYIRFTSNSAVTFTIDIADATLGKQCIIEQAGTGQVTFAGTATRVNSRGHTKTYSQYSLVSCFCPVAGTVNFSGRTA
jgi:hypothetical protein